MPPSPYNLLKDAVEKDHRADFIKAQVHFRGIASLAITYIPLRNYPNPGIDQHIANAGWDITRTESDVELIVDCVEPQSVPAKAMKSRLFHATRSEHSASVEQQGITTSVAGGTWMGRTYHTPRPFHALSMAANLEFIKSIKGGNSAQSSSALAGWEIFSFSPEKDIFYPDAEHSQAVSTETVTEPVRLTKAEDWR